MDVITCVLTMIVEIIFENFYKSKQGLSNHVLNMHSGLVESVKGNILKEYYGKVSTESNKICIYSVMRTERGGMS